MTKESYIRSVGEIFADGRQRNSQNDRALALIAEGYSAREAIVRLALASHASGKVTGRLWEKYRWLSSELPEPKLQEPATQKKGKRFTSFEFDGETLSVTLEGGEVVRFSKK